MQNLKRISEKNHTQESRILHSLVQCIDGEKKEWLNILLSKIKHDWLRGTSDWAMTRIIDIARQHKLFLAERDLRECFRDRDPDNFEEYFLCSNILADIGFEEDAAWDTALRYKRQPKSRPIMRGHMLEFSSRIQRPQLRNMALYDIILYRS